MPSTHERTSAELKATAVRRYLDEGVQASEICDELDISPREFRQWQRQVHEQELERRDARIAALKAELERRGWLEDGGGETETPADTSSTPSDAPTRSLSPPRAPGTPTHDLRGSSSPDLDPSPSSEWSATVPLAPSIGALLGPYVINDTLGQGGMGRVYRAFDRRLNRNVALKVLHDDLDLHEHGRLVREAQAMAQLTHPNVVQVYEVGEHRGQHYVAMELVEGQTLRTWQRHEPRPDWRACVSVYLQAGEGLAAAHHCDLVHRDFKPSNVLLDEQGRVRVLDFGLARSGTVPVQPSQDHSHGRSESTSARNSTWDRHLRTQTGVVMGTPGYMPPEQIGGRDVDARGDQFSFCVALYEAVYGQRPFGGQSLEELEQAILQGQVAPLKSRTRVPAKLEAVIMRGLSFEPDDRWPSMAALLEELRRLVAPRARRWVVGSVAVATLGLGGSWAFGHYLEIKDRCTGAAEQVAEVWGEDAGQRVKAAILGTELSYAPDTWAQVESRLDTYTEAWAAEHTDACEATQVRHEQSEEEMSLRMGCLHDRWVHLRATVGELGQADAKVVENAVRAVTSLPRLERCRDLEALAAEVRPPEDPAVAKQVEALEEVLAEAKAKQDAGKYDAGLHLADEVVKRGEPLGYEPLMARAWLRQGTLRRNAGDYEGAVTALKQAHGAALAQSMMAEASSASSDLMYVLGQLLARHEEAHRWSEHAEPLSRAAGETIARASYFSSLGAIADSQGEYEDARRFHERALAIKEKAMGPQHPTVATSLNNLGNAASALGDQEDARAALERALAIWKEAFGPGHPRVAGALSNLSTVAYMQGEYQDARAFLERALAISEQALGPRHINLAYTLNNLGLLASSQQEHEDARAFLERALAISEEALGPRHPIVATSLHNLGDVASSQEQYEDAQEFYERALAIFDEALDPQHPDHAFALTGLGNALIALDRPADALLPLERALSIRTTHQVEPVLLADTRFALARALWAAPADLGGDRPRARPLAEQARETYASLGDTGRDGLDEIAAWLTNHRLQ